MKKETPTSKATGKYGALIQKAKSADNQLAGLPVNQREEVNLSIKVPKQWRRHWVAEAKRQDTSLTAVIIALLKEKFGEPTEF